MKTKMTFRKPKWLRRFSSAILDLFAAIILALLFSFVATPLSNSLFDSQTIYDTYYGYAVSTHIYEYNDNGGVSLIDDLDTMDQNITLFYKECTDNKLDEYETSKSERLDLFVYDEIKQSYIELDYDKTNYDIKAQYILFYENELNKCVNNYLDNYLNQFDDYKIALSNLNKMLYFTIVISALFGLVVIYLLIPMIHKEGKTIGKMAFRLKVVSKVGTSPTPTKLQILFRQLVTIFFEFILSIATLGFVGIVLPITLLISTCLLFLTKLNQSFHDLCCSTFIIDEYPNNNPITENEKYEVIYITDKEEL